MHFYYISIMCTLNAFQSGFHIFIMFYSTSCTQKNIIARFTITTFFFYAHFNYLFFVTFPRTYAWLCLLLLTFSYRKMCVRTCILTFKPMPFEFISFMLYISYFHLCTHISIYILHHLYFLILVLFMFAFLSCMYHASKCVELKSYQVRSMNRL